MFKDSIKIEKTFNLGKFILDYFLFAVHQICLDIKSINLNIYLKIILSVIIINDFFIILIKMISVLSNIVLVAGFGNFAYSYYISRKENMYDNLFKEIEKCQKYHLDYVEKVDQLPSDRNLLLFGTPHSLTAEKIITKTYIKKN